MPPANITSLRQSSRAPPVPSLAPSEETVSSHTESLVDVDSPHVSSVPSDYQDQAIKTDTQATRIEHEAEDTARRESRKAADAAKEAKQKAAAKAKELKAEAKKEGKKLNDNRDNPVVVGNAVIWGCGDRGDCSCGLPETSRGEVGLAYGRNGGGCCGRVQCRRLLRLQVRAFPVPLPMIDRQATGISC